MFLQCLPPPQTLLLSSWIPSYHPQPIRAYSLGSLQPLKEAGHREGLGRGHSNHGFGSDQEGEQVYPLISKQPLPVEAGKGA